MIHSKTVPYKDKFIVCALIFMSLLRGAIAKESSVIWSATFEDSTLTDFDYVLHAQGITLEELPNATCGSHVAKITVLGTDDYLWRGNSALNRVEVQYQPDTVKPDSTTYFSWYFKLPDTLPNSVHQLAYWESDKSYSQIMRLEATGEKLQFFHTLSNRHIGAVYQLKPSTWYKVAMSITWSPFENQGLVSVWLNDTPFLLEVSLQTLVSENEKAFIQMGILREQSDNPVTIYLDHAVEVRNKAALFGKCN